jgi:hypothetical protein
LMVSLSCALIASVPVDGSTSLTGVAVFVAFGVLGLVIVWARRMATKWIQPPP